jgi:hypothetical protein
MLRKDIRGFIDGIFVRLDSIENTFHNLLGAISNRNESSDHPQGTQNPINVRAEVHTSPEEIRDNNTRDERQHHVQLGTMFGTWAAFVAAAIYAGIAAHQSGDIKKSARAAQEAAYASCLGVRTANYSLLEYQRAAIDSHLSSVAAYAQAMVAMQSQKAFVEADFTVPGNRSYGQPLWMLFRLKNTGRSDASNIRLTGWVIVAKPNSGATSERPKEKFLFTMQKDSMRVGEQFFPDLAGTAKDGNPHGLYIPAVNAEGNPFVDTNELDKAIFIEHKLTIFEFYTISYEDFTAHYTRNSCGVNVVLGPDPSTVTSADFDKRCNDYNTQTEVPKIPMPPPSNSVPSDKFPEINCTVPKD